jgi:chromosome segregation ATPase
MEPEILTLSIKVLKKGDIGKVYSSVLSLSGFRVYKAGNVVYVSILEKEDVQKKPVKFIIVEFKEEEINVHFTVSEEESPSIRKLEVISKTLPIIEAVLDAYQISVKPLISIIDAALTEMLQRFTREMKDVLIENDRLRDRIKEKEEKIKRQDEQIKELTAKLYELNSENSELRLKLGKYEKISEEALEEMLMEWLREHKGTIDLAEFSQMHKVPVSRLEEVLNGLVQKGYIKPL